MKQLFLMSVFVLFSLRSFAAPRIIADDIVVMDFDRSGEETVSLKSRIISPEKIVSYEIFEDDSEFAHFGYSLENFRQSLEVGRHTFLVKVKDAKGEKAEALIKIEVKP